MLILYAYFICYFFYMVLLLNDFDANFLRQYAVNAYVYHIYLYVYTYVYTCVCIFIHIKLRKVKRKKFLMNLLLSISDIIEMTYDE
jgi:hypothetical protein